MKELEYTNYYNMKRIYNIDEARDDTTNFRQLQLSAHPNFDDSLVNLQESAVHVPINVYEVSGQLLVTAPQYRHTCLH